jgi:hypothetical protein
LDPPDPSNPLHRPNFTNRAKCCLNSLFKAETLYDVLECCMKCRYEVSIKKKERKNLSTRLFHFAIGRLVSNLIFCLRVIKYSDLKVKYINKSIFKCQEYTPHVKRFKLNRRAFLVEGVNLKGEVEFVYPELPAALENYPEEVWLGTNKYYRHAASKA